MTKRSFVKLYLHLLSTYFSCLAQMDNSPFAGAQRIPLPTVYPNEFVNSSFFDKNTEGLNVLNDLITTTTTEELDELDDLENTTTDELDEPDDLESTTTDKLDELDDLESTTYPFFDQFKNMSHLYSNNSESFDIELFKMNRSDYLETVQFFMDSYCPFGEYCKGNKNEPLIPSPSAIEPCCKDCACDDTCGSNEENVCCFPASPEVVTTQYRECLSVQSKNTDTDTVPHYYMITKCPDIYSTSAEYSKAIAQSCRADESLFGLVPVFSKRTRLIYRNRYCAKCHNSFDVIAYTPFMSCPKDAEDVLSDILKNKIPPNCYLHFQYPGNLVDVQHNRCCPKTYNFTFPHVIPLSLTRQSAISLCEAGPYSPFSVIMTNNVIEQFPNIFCSICSSNTTAFVLIGICTDYNNFAISTSTLLVILDMDILEDMVKHETEKDKSVGREACRALVTGETECRNVLCPLGQSFNPAGECVYYVKGMLIEEFRLSLKLSPESSFSFCTIEGFIHNKDFKSFLKHSWPNNWIIVKIFIQPNACSDTVSEKNSLPYLGVTMTMTAGKSPTSPRKLAEVIALVKITVTKNWYFDKNRTFIRLKSQFLDFELKNGSAKTYLKHDTSLISQHWVPSSKVSLQITKLYYCERIALKDDEYVLYDIETSNASHFRVLYLKESEKVLLPKQFSLQAGASESHFPTVCLSDTSFHKVSKSLCNRLHYTSITSVIALLTIIFIKI